MEMKRVAVWAASGEEFIKEADRSAATFMGHMPDIPRILITDGDYHTGSFNDMLAVPPMDEHKYLKRIRFWQYAIMHLPHEIFVFFDTDTYVCAPIYDLYAVLERFDFVGCLAPRRDPFPVKTVVPAAFSTVNAGMLGFKKGTESISLIHDWLIMAKRLFREYRELGYAFFTDQVSLREALWAHPSIRIWIAPPEYNCRFTCGVFADGMVKVLHGRAEDIDSVARSINASSEPRLWKCSY